MSTTNTTLTNFEALIPTQSDEVDHYHNRHQHEDVAKVKHNVSSSVHERKKSAGTLSDDFASSSCTTSVSSSSISNDAKKASASSKEANITTVSFRRASKEAKKVSVKKETSHTHTHTHAYDIPENMIELIKKSTVPKVFKKPLSSSSYKDFFSYLLYAEDYYIKKWSDFSLSNVSLELQKATMCEKPSKGKKLTEKAERDDTYYVAFDLGSIPSLSARDFVLVHLAGKKVKPFQGILYRVVKNTALVKFKEDFHSQHHPNCRYDVNFSFNREFLKRCHQAIDYASANPLLLNFLFPNPAISSSSGMPTRNLKEKEAFAIDQVCRLAGAPPYLIEGSPSVTFGKISTTGTLIEEMVVEISRKNPSSRILMCAPTNDICDVLMRSLRRKVSGSGILPANAAFGEFDGMPADNLSSRTNEGEGFTCHSLEELQNFKIIVSTYMTSFRLTNEGLTSGHFSHIILVDASLATEPETMVTLANFVAEKTVVVATGTERTFPTWLRSDIGRKYGLQKSYFQRIFERKHYSNLCPNLVMCISEHGKE